MTEAKHATSRAVGAFDPISIGPVEASGRVFKAATAETRAHEDGTVSDELLAFYEPIVRADTPLIITGNLYVSEQGRSTWRMAGIDADDKLPGLREWADVLHSSGGVAIAQLNHAGRQIAGATHAVSASAVREPLMGTKPRPLRADELPDVIESFAAAARAAEAGFDGVQIHMAHGYLLSQFLTPHTNRRTDSYGGSLRNRIRLAVEVTKAVRDRVGDDIAVIAKLNGTDALPMRAGAPTADLIEVARALEDSGLDGIEISRGHYESGPGMVAGDYRGFLTAQVREGGGTRLSAARRLAATAVAPLAERALSRTWPAREGFNLPQAAQFTSALTIPVICVGGFHTRSAIEGALVSGKCDAVSIARAMIANPNLYRHLHEPEPDAPVCAFTNGCIARSGGRPVDCYNDQVRAVRESMLALGGHAPDTQEHTP